VNEPDWEALKRISTERLALQDAGRWNRAEFERLLAEAKRAVNGHDEFLESLVNHADPAWLE
jgi:hypothetical protein